MKYESAKTEKGNVGVSYESQKAADLQAAAMDKNGCSDCYHCSGCYDCYHCSGCSGCFDCYHCSGCTDCTDCSGCYRCSGCSGCSDCSDCYHCSGCTDCSGCSDCSDCSDCSGCYRCFGCSGCTDCTDCIRCYGCTGCTNTKGAIKWNGEPAKNLLSLNGLRWPVSTDGKNIQIGCQHYSVDEWRAFDDRMIARMDSGALEFWKWHKEMILSLAEVRKNMEEES